MVNFKEIASFTLIGLLPVLSLTLGVHFMGFWPLLSLIVIAVIGPIVDSHVESSTQDGTPNFTIRAMPYVLFVSHVILLPLGIWAIVQDAPPVTRAIHFIAFGLFFGTISMANGHELIHRRDRASFNLGRLIFTSLLFGHHISSHLLLHHRFAGTRQDPSTARLGQSFYSFVLSAWLHGFVRGKQAENARRYSAGRLDRIHPYTYYVGGGVSILLGVFVWLGLRGVFVYVALSIFAASQLLIVDYVQHYGLLRKKTKSGKYEPIGVQHSWNAPFFYSSRMTLNAPNHSDHHANPSKPYYALSSSPNMPTLPYSISVMAAFALCPPLWFRIMDDRAKAWL